MAEKSFEPISISTSNIRGRYKNPTDPKTVKHVEKEARKVFKEDNPGHDPARYEFKHKGPKHVTEEDFRPHEKDYNSYHQVAVQPKGYKDVHDKLARKDPTHED